MTVELARALGTEHAAEAYVDGLHSNAYGSYLFARCIVEGIRQSKITSSTTPAALLRLTLRRNRANLTCPSNLVRRVARARVLFRRGNSNGG